MNILVPDCWLRTYLKTKATPLQIKEYLSLCGPSVERIYGSGKKTVYDIEITGNRPDTMSVIGVAREAATILPRFGIKAELLTDPYTDKILMPKARSNLKLTLKTDPKLNPRWMSIIFDHVTVAPSPSWLKQYLKLAGIRSLNNVVDITNFLMRAYGQPAHVFDYDAISGHTMILRASKKGETLITLDGKKHTLPGDDIVIEDGTGKLIDLCGIMGGENSSVTEKTTRVILFLQTYDPAHIRKTSMALAHRTEAAGLFEKGLDTELVKPVIMKGTTLMTEITGGSVASNVLDIYPDPFTGCTVTVALSKVHAYIGHIENHDIQTILTSLHFSPVLSKDIVTVTVPSYRRDVLLDVDVIEEIARIYGYHTIAAALPDSAPPMTQPDRHLLWEDEIKVRLRDWGFTELYTYSMISEEQMDQFFLDKTKAYKIANPLSSEWVYMRPHAIASTLPAFIHNLKVMSNLKAFELTMSYLHRTNDLPKEVPVLNVLWLGDKFFEAKGLAETLFDFFGIAFQPDTAHTSDRYTEKSLKIGDYASMGVLKQDFLRKLGTDAVVTRLYINIEKMVRDAKPVKQFIPIPKHPPIVEDLSFVVPERFIIGPLISALKSAHPLVASVELLDVHENSRTLHITYQDPKKNLTNEDIIPVRDRLVEIASQKFGLSLKTPSLLLQKLYS